MTNQIREFFDQRACSWDERCRHDPKKIAAVVTLAGIGPGARVADIACGTGVLFPEILSRGPAELLGIDLSGNMIARAQSKFSDPRLRLLAADLFDVTETGFDCVMLFSAYPHFPDKARLAAHLAAMLAPGGRFMVAHSEGKNAVNRCHSGKPTLPISWELRAVREEAAAFSEFFAVDMLADTAELYFFSGVKKPAPEG